VGQHTEHPARRAARRRIALHVAGCPLDAHAARVAHPKDSMATWWDGFLERIGFRVPAVAPDPWPDWRTAYWPAPVGNPALYARLYRTQPHVRTVVEFLAIQLGQLGIQCFRRVSDTDRVRVSGHPVERLFREPNPDTPRYRFISELVMDFGVYGNAYALKVRQPNRLSLYRIPAAQLVPDGDLVVRGYRWTLPNSGAVAWLPASEVVHLRGYDPDNPLAGLSPIETLCRLLLEEQSATDYRASFWKNAARLGGVIYRPKDAPRWSPEQRKLFRKDWKRYEGGRAAGKTVVLEDGMTYETISGTARDAQLVETRKLTREEVAAAYHVPPAMIGITESQGYGSLREQHKGLYQDTLGPYVAMLEGEFQLQILSEFSDSDDVYVQFNTHEKLQGSFDEESTAITTAVGSPYMSRNEARARLNLPRINDPDFDKPVTRLDTDAGQSSKQRAATED
jgi:HK97 family phage portal protein